MGKSGLDWGGGDDSQPLSKKQVKKQVKADKKQSKKDDHTRRSYFFDYNTVESTLLGCAVIVCLSGVMFENERFKDRSDVAWEKEVMTWCVFAVIFGSIFYYSMVFVAEVLGYTPSWLVKCFASRKTRQAQSHAKGGKTEEEVEMSNMAMNSNPMANHQMAGMLAQQKEADEDMEAMEARLKMEKDAKDRLMGQYRNLKKTYEQSNNKPKSKRLSTSKRPAKKAFGQTGAASGRRESTTENPIHDSSTKTPMDGVDESAGLTKPSSMHDML